LVLLVRSLPSHVVTTTPSQPLRAMASSENHFQVVVLGTGLVESIAAA
jgi:hypothetical protein